MRIVIKDLTDLERAAREFLREKPEGSVVALYGAMGAGKTTFTKALCRVLGVPDSVNSPTFTIINEYRDKNGNPVFHFDLYRIEKLEEVYDIGIEEFLYSGRLCLIEWPEKMEQLLPEDCIRVTINVLADGSRELIF
jgi:tRNA threonylcarbamoyladenosine biosynthesis protein TsaE